MKKIFNKNKTKSDLKAKEKLWFTLFVLAVIFIGFLTILPQLQALFSGMNISTLDPNITRFINNQPALSSLIQEQPINQDDHNSLIDKLNAVGLQALFNENNMVVDDYFEQENLQPTSNFSLTANELGAFVNMVLHSANNTELSIIEINIKNHEMQILSTYDITDFLHEADISSKNNLLYLSNTYSFNIQNNQLYLQSYNLLINGYSLNEAQLLKYCLNVYILQSTTNYTLSDISAHFVATIINNLSTITKTNVNIGKNVIFFDL